MLMALQKNIFSQQSNYALKMMDMIFKVKLHQQLMVGK